MNIHKRSSFDDMSIGRLGHSGRTIKGRLVDRPSGLTTKDWYALARGREGAVLVDWLMEKADLKTRDRKGDKYERAKCGIACCFAAVSIL